MAVLERRRLCTAQRHTLGPALQTGRLRPRIKVRFAIQDRAVHSCGARREDEQTTGFFMETARSLRGEGGGATRQ